ncbi:MAG: carboxypeptidase-like regulatory domain-containing protein [Flammeovirgaceae bacterium]|nr:carboxypeptidase-like regulatory domain-containing protein [Flammeovirgaceae bacterium]
MNLKLSFLFFVISLGLNSNLMGQSHGDIITIKGKILDAQTKEEIPFVNIYYPKSNVGTSSDVEGDFSIQIKKQDFSDTLVISAIGYKTNKVPTFEMLNHSDQILYLEEDVLTLDEITVSAIPAVEVIKLAMAKRKNNYGIAPHKLSGTYRITDQENGAYVRLLEAAVAIYDPNYLKKNSRIVDYLATRQSKDFRTFKWKVDKFNKRNADELLKPDLIKRPTRATHPNGFEKGFFYKFENYSILNNEDVFVISATKNPTMQWPNYNATFYIRIKDYAILRVDRDYNIGRPNWARAPNVITDITKDQLILKYKEINGKLYLNYFLWNLKGNILEARNAKKITSFERNEELNIHSVTLTKLKRTPKTWEDDIYKIVEPYNQELWENHPISNTQLFREVSKELEEKQDLYEQFNSSDGKYTLYNPTRTYKTKELKQDFLLFKKSLEEGHPSLYLYTTPSEFSKYFDSTYQNISARLTEVEFYQLLTPLIARINCGHTQGLLSEEYYAFYDHRDFYFPLQTKFINGKLYLSKDYIFSDTLKKGSQIISVNGETIKSIKKTIDKHLSSDGYIQTSKDQIFGQEFSRLYSIYYEMKDKFSIELKMHDGQILNLNISGISLSDYYSHKEKANGTNQYEIIKPGVALLKVRSFTDSQYQDFKIWIKNSFLNISENNIQNLIIDLRDNNGGRDDFAIFLYSFLSSKPFNFHDYLEAATNNYSFLAFTDQDNSLNELMHKIVQVDSAGRCMLNNTHPTLGIHERNLPTYNGRVIFLVNGNTFSAAADLAAIARNYNRGIFIGEETGGTAIGNTSNGELILTLPNTGIRVKIPQFKIVNAVNTTIEGRGVTTDYKVIYNHRDIIIQNRDKELEVALDIID